MKAELLYSSQCYLGEGPLWDARSGVFYWLDINAARVYARDWKDGYVHHWDFDDAVGFAALGNEGELLLATGTTLNRFDTVSGKLERLVNLEPGMPDHRCNDGCVDAKGRLWVGTTHRDHLHEAGALYMIDTDLTVRKMLDHLTITNGMCWAPEGSRLYHIDSPTGKVQCFLLDTVTDDLHWERTAITIPSSLGNPDGMTMDADGMLWIAHWGGMGVYRWDPLNGELLGKIDVPAPHVSSCVFAGPGLDHLVITTARKEMSAAALAAYPLSGDVFIAEPGVKGLPALRRRE
jgi:sugar lactone lactonase YvrE